MARPSKETVERRSELILEGLYLCGRCLEVRPLLEFGKEERSKYGIRSTCKYCTNSVNKISETRQLLELGVETYKTKKLAQLDKWKKNTKPKRIEHFKRKEREANLKRCYGITIHDFNTLLANQDGRCAICSTTHPQRKWHVDHNHETGGVRGILCNLCNVGLGAFKENVDALAMAEVYLRPRAKL